MESVYYINSREVGESLPEGWYGPGWYFWDETETVCIGPFTSEVEARGRLEEYANLLNK